MAQSKYWCFTINNYDDNDMVLLNERFFANEFCYIVYGREVGVQGTNHLQGYLELPSKKRLSSLRRLIPNAHLEQRKGTAEEASEYCKGDGDYYEFGEISVPQQGKRNDLLELQAALNNAVPMQQISQDFFGQFLKYQRGITAYKYVNSIKRDWLCSVIVYWGRTGAGKTRCVYDNLLSKDEIYVHPGGQWFDGYDGQPIVLFDDYAGSEFKLQYLLKLLDRYPMQVPVKGGFVSFIPKEIYITSNINPSDWYRNANGEHVRAMFRRFTNVFEFQ